MTKFGSGGPAWDKGCDPALPPRDHGRKDLFNTYEVLFAPQWLVGRKRATTVVDARHHALPPTCLLPLCRPKRARGRIPPIELFFSHCCHVGLEIYFHSSVSCESGGGG